MKSNSKARVSLVGAGPGDADLITVKGLKAIQTADVILYDALVNKDLLDHAPKTAITLFVGKRAGVACKKQSQINDLIVKSAFEFGHVVRLKGGDPYIFGRGHEEKIYAESFNLPVEVIPGISSVTSLPLLQDVPLTRREVSESFWVLTGSTRHHALSTDIKLAAKSNATLVILMAMRKLELICEILNEEGKSELPIMLIQSGSTSEEICVVGTVNTIVTKALENNISTPGIIVAGEVVSLHPEFIKERIYQWRS